MIDFIDFSVDTDHPVAIGKPLSLVQPAGHRTHSFTEMKVCAGKNAPAFTLHYNVKTKRLQFEGSPIKFLQLHNAYGCDDLQWLVQQTVPSLFRTLKMPIPPDVMHRIVMGDYSISKVDVTRHFRLPAGTVAELCEWIRVHAPAAMKATPLERGIGVRLCPNSRSNSYLIYDKAQFFTDNTIKHRRTVLGHIPLQTFEHIGTNILFNQMRRELVNVVRVEAKFGRTLSTQRWQLHHGSAWTPTTASELFYESVKQLPLGALTAGTSFEHIIADAAVPSHHRQAIALWVAGRDVKALSSSPATYYRLRKELLKRYAIDLSAPPPVASTFNWSEIVDPANEVGTPDWAVAHGYVHTPETIADGYCSPLERAWLSHGKAAARANAI
jgi:hypothetical protein